MKKSVKYNAEGYRTHPNGGGKVHRYATVDDSVFVGPDAKIGGGSRAAPDGQGPIVQGRVVLKGRSIISGLAQVRTSAGFDSIVLEDECCIVGDADVSGRFVMSERASINGFATVKGDDLRISGEAWIHDYAQVSGSGNIQGNTAIHGKAKVYGNPTLINAKLTYDCIVRGSATIQDATIAADVIVEGNAVLVGDFTIHGAAVIRRYLYSIRRSDGYTFVVYAINNQLWVSAGCRFFNMADAKKHWKETRGGTDLGRETMLILDTLGDLYNIRTRKKIK